MKLLIACLSLCTIVAPNAAAQKSARRAKTRTLKADSVIFAPPAGEEKPLAEFRRTEAGREEELIERILEKSVEAEGGATALMSIKTRITRGRVDYSKSNMPGNFESYSKSPNKSLYMLEIPGGQFVVSYDGQNGWYSSPFMSGPLTDEDASEKSSGGNEGVNFSLRYRDRFSSIKYKGEAKVGEREAHLLEGIPRGSVPVLMYFDKRGGLLLRLDFQHPQAKSGMLRTIYFDKYARVDGVQVPIKLRNLHGDYTFTFNVYEVKHNVVIADAMFESPKRGAGR